MRSLVALLFIMVSTSAFPDTVTRVIDTGARLATVTRFNNGQIMVYDTGHWNHDNALLAAFQAFIGDHDIDLLITSHSDSDHVAATDELFNNFRIHRVIRTGFTNTAATWGDHDDAITDAADLGLTHDVNLANVTLPHGTVYRFGDATVTYLSGFHRPPDDWGIGATTSEFRNANSVVVRLEYQGNSILFTGDAVGRVEDTDDGTPAMGTEAYLIANRAARPIASTILFAPHHGGDDGSSADLINAVNAQWVIFSAGHAHEHPLRVTAERYIDAGYANECLLRTDLGDDHGNDEWDFGRINNHVDQAFDDSIEITLPTTGGDPTVGYVGGNAVNCPDLGLVHDGGGQPPLVTVRMSRNQICHAPDSPWYDRMTFFTEFDSVQACLNAGGRLPR